MIKIEHIAIWTKNLEKMRAFYCKYFNGISNEKYVNSAKGFSSYFITFASGTRLEIMHSTKMDNDTLNDGTAKLGLIHLAISLGSRDQVDNLTQILRDDGYAVLSNPRQTGDGYYESCVLDPENNQIELSI